MCNVKLLVYCIVVYRVVVVGCFVLHVRKLGAIFWHQDELSGDMRTLGVTYARDAVRRQAGILIRDSYNELPADTSRNCTGEQAH